MSEQRDGEARVDEDDEAFMEAWGSLKTYTLHAYSERYSPSIRHDGPNVRTYDADAVDALLARLRPAFQVGPADDPLTCSKCGGPTRENGRWHPDLGAVFGYELGLRRPDTPEVAERSEKCPTCGGAVDDPGYDEINAGDQTGRDYCPDPFHTPESSDPDRYGETGGGEAPERADDPTDHSEEQAAGAGRESRAAISSEQRNCFAPLHPPVSSEEDRARGLDTRFIGLSVVAHTGDGPIQGVIVDYDDYAAEIRSGAMHERVTWPCLYWPKDEAREPAKWDDRGSACGGARPVSSEEDRSMVRRWHRIGLYDAPQIRAILTDATTLASQHSEERGK